MIKKKIITFSRRTDPASHMDWLIDKIEHGGCYVPNPINGVPYYVDLQPEAVTLLNFWTKAPSAILPYFERLSAYKLALFITHTNYPSWMEPEVPDLKTTIAAVTGLHEKLTARGLPTGLWWRYDPVIFSKKLSKEWHIANFKMLCEKVWAKRTNRVIVSLAHVAGSYKAIGELLGKDFAARGDSFVPAGHDEFVELAAALAAIGREHGISLEVCCSPIVTPEDSAKYGIKQGECIAKKALKDLDIDPPSKVKPTRMGDGVHYGPCGCLASTDIGSNGTCVHKCVYCYADRKGNEYLAIPADKPWLSTSELPVGLDYPKK